MAPRRPIASATYQSPEAAALDRLLVLWRRAGPSPISALRSSAIGAWMQAPADALIIAGVLLALLLVGIRNAWDLVTWLAPRAPRD